MFAVGLFVFIVACALMAVQGGRERYVEPLSWAMALGLSLMGASLLVWLWRVMP
jgi:hypothetical protein